MAAWGLIVARGGFSTQIDIAAGLAKPLAALRRLRDLGGDLTPFMQDAGAILLASTLNRFRTSKGPGGIPWKPNRRGGKILVDTGDLQGSIRTEVTSNSVEVGSDGLSNPVKAIANQFGSHRQTVVLAHQRTVTTAFGAPLASAVTQSVRAHGRMTNLPARPFIGVDDDDETDIKEAWQARIIRTFGNGG